MVELNNIFKVFEIVDKLAIIADLDSKLNTEFVEILIEFIIQILQIYIRKKICKKLTTRQSYKTLRNESEKKNKVENDRKLKMEELLYQKTEKRSSNNVLK
jgi:hypothetical protein